MTKVWIRRPLCRRHNEVLQLLGEGHTESEIAQRLGIGIGTVRTYLDEMKRRFHVSRRAAVRQLARNWSAGELRIYVRAKRERI